jgi:predicted RNA-binding Zn-ribbon protein involved in translation (DUF1610 family)
MWKNWAATQHYLSEVPMTRIQTVFAKSGGDKRMRKIRDSQIHTSCPACGEAQVLSQAKIAEDGEETVYRCRAGCQPLLIISKPESKGMPGRGFRLGNFLIRNVTDLIIPGTTGDVLIPASSAALVRRTDL